MCELPYPSMKRKYTFLSKSLFLPWALFNNNNNNKHHHLLYLSRLNQSIEPRGNWCEMVIRTIIINYGIYLKMYPHLNKRKSVKSYLYWWKYVCWENTKTTFSSLQACFRITHSSGDFIDKNICNHRLSNKKLA